MIPLPKLAQQPPRIKLFWRIFLTSLCMLVVVVVISVSFNKLLRGVPPRVKLVHHIAYNIHENFGDIPQSSPLLKKKLIIWSKLLHRDIALLQPDGTLILAAQSGPRQKDELLPIVPLNPTAAKGDTAYLWVAHHWGDSAINNTLGLALTLIVLALLSVVLVRRISLPLQQLSDTASRLAQGDLGARCDLNRNDELGILGQNIDKMAKRLEVKIHQEKELLANISHEIRTPLTRLRIALELCEDGAQAPQNLRDYLSGMSADIGDLEQLISDVFVITRLDFAMHAEQEQSLILRTKKIALRELGNKALGAARRQHPTHNFQAHYNFQITHIIVDESLLRRVLYNLLDNAAKYSKVHSTVHLSITQPTLDALQINIRDQGIGITNEDLPHIFEPFFRSTRNDTPAPVSGTGLGLTLCKRIIDAHNGSITAHSPASGGCHMRIELPLESPQP